MKETAGKQVLNYGQPLKRGRENPLNAFQRNRKHVPLASDNTYYVVWGNDHCGNVRACLSWLSQMNWYGIRLGLGLNCNATWRHIVPPPRLNLELEWTHTFNVTKEKPPVLASPQSLPQSPTRELTE